MTAPSDSEQPLRLAEARYEAITDYIAELEADAARWRYVRDRLLIEEVSGTVMTYWFNHIQAAHPHRTTEVIDKLIAAEREQPEGDK